MGGLPKLMPRLSVVSRRMARIDRLGWRAGTCFDAHGFRVGVRSNDPGLLERLPRVLPPGWKAAASPVVDQIFSLWVAPRRTGVARTRVCTGEARGVRTGAPSQALDALESQIRLAVAASSRERIFVHAGVVGWRGRAIVLPGRSRSGKTTLVRELVRAGACYLSDEFALFDGLGRVHPFAKPLTIRGPAGCDVHARRLSVEELGGKRGIRPLRVGVVAFTEFREDAAWQPSPLSAGQAVVELLAHTVPARLRPEAALESLSQAVSGALRLRGPRGGAAETARHLLRLLEGSP